MKRRPPRTPSAPARKKIAIKAEDRESREKNARKAREAMEEMLTHMPGMRTSIIQEWFELNPKKTVEQGQIWRLVTSTFCHDRYDVWHILFNMLLLYWFGQRLEQMYGSTEFLLFYLVAAVCASLAYVALAYYTGSTVPAIGASGAIMGVMMLYVIFYPFEQFLLFWFIPVPLWALLSIYVAVRPASGLTGFGGRPDVHGCGARQPSRRIGIRVPLLAVRLAAGTAPGPRSAGPDAGGKSKPRLFREPVIRKFVPRDSDLTDRVDEVLKKISEQGTASLTEAERDLLIEAAAKYRGAK